jgi:hypothetical protein
MVRERRHPESSQAAHKYVPRPTNSHMAYTSLFGKKFTTRRRDLHRRAETLHENAERPTSLCMITDTTYR